VNGGRAGAIQRRGPGQNGGRERLTNGNGYPTINRNWPQSARPGNSDAYPGFREGSGPVPDWRPRSHPGQWRIRVSTDYIGPISRISMPIAVHARAVWDAPRAGALGIGYSIIRRARRFIPRPPEFPAGPPAPRAPRAPALAPLSMLQGVLIRVAREPGRQAEEVAPRRLRTEGRVPVDHVWIETQKQLLALMRS
jgi:hypothetical protein